MNYGIGNVKAKGGGNPTITLSASQFSDATNLTFTQAQAEILQNNEVVNVVLPDNSTRTIYKATNDYIGAIVFSQSTQDISSEIGGQMANVLVLCNPSTYEGMVIQAELNGTIANPTLSGNETELTSIGIGSQAYKIGGGSGSGTTLYSHSLIIQVGNGTTNRAIGTLQIINDSSTPFTTSSLYNYLRDNNYISDSSMKNASGQIRTDGSTYSLIGIYGGGSSGSFGYCYCKDDANYYTFKEFSISNIYDTIVDLGVASVGGGKQLYKHNIKIRRTVSPKAEINLIIENTDSTSFTGTTLKTYIMDKFSALYSNLGTTAGLMASGGVYVSSRIIVSNLVGNKDNNSIMARGFASTNQYDWVAIDLEDTNTQIVDDVITL